MMTEEISKYVKNTGTIILRADDINITKHDEDTRGKVYFVYLPCIDVLNTLWDRVQFLLRRGFKDQVKFTA